MSGLARLGKKGVELLIDVRSTMEDALKAIPDQNMSPQNMRNGLVSRGVQDREVRMSGLTDYINTSEEASLPVNSKEILRWLKEEGRRDKYTVHEIRGTAYKRRPFTQEDRLLRIQNLAEEVGDDPNLVDITPEQYLANVNAGIAEGRITIGDDITSDWYDRLRAVVNETPQQGQYDNIEWQTLLREEGRIDPTLDANAMTEYNVNNFLTRQQNELADVRANPEAYENAEAYVVQIQEAIADANRLNDDLLRGVTPDQEGVILSENLISDWRDIVTELGGDDQVELSMDSIDNFISGIREDIASHERYDDESIAIFTEAMEDRIDQAEAIRGRLQHEIATFQPQQEEWINLLSDEGYYGDLDNLPIEDVPLTLNNISAFILRQESRMGDQVPAPYMHQFENRIERATDLFVAIEDANVTGRIDRVSSILDEYGFVGEDDYQFVEEAFENMDQFAETVHRVQGPEAAEAFKNKLLTSGFRSREQLLRSHGFQGYNDPDYLNNIEADDLDSIIASITEDEGGEAARMFEIEFNASRAEGTNEFAPLSRAQPTQAVPEQMDAILQTSELVEEAETAFRDLADTYEFVNAPDVNDAEAVNKFLDDIKYMQANTPGIEDTTDIQALQDSYNIMRQHVEAGDTTVTVPNYNTHMVDPNVTWTFPDKAFEAYTLPDTNRATYAVRVYKNSAADTKEFPYTEVSHWQGDSNVEGGVFQTRIDYPEPGSRRIMETQSDTQNQMTKAKKQAIKYWKGIEDVPTATQIMESTLIDSPVVAKIRKGANKDFVESLDSYIGIGSIDEFENIMGGPIESASLEEMRRYMVELATNGRFGLDMPEDMDKLVLNKVINGFEIRSDIDIKSLMKTIKKYNPDLTEDQVDLFAGTFRDTGSTYQELLGEYRGEALDELREAAKLRVTYGERIERIKLGADVGNATKEENAVLRKAITKTFNHYNDKYGFTVSMKGGRLAGPNTVQEGILEQVAKKVIDYVHEGGTVPAHLKEGSFRLFRAEIKREINKGSFKGLEYIELAFPDTFVIKDVLKEADELLESNIKTGMKDLTPLEKFPDAAKYELDIPWRKQSIQNEVIEAIGLGDKEVLLTVNPPGVEKLSRAPNVQLNYENGGSINDTFRSVAKRFGVPIVEEGGYLKMKLTAGTAAGVTTIPLYADTNEKDGIQRLRDAGIDENKIAAYLEKNDKPEVEEPLSVQKALDAGHSPEVIKEYQQKQLRAEIDETTFAEHPGYLSDLPTIDGSQSYNKLPIDTIKDIAIELEVDPSTPYGMDLIYEEAMYKNNPGLREANKIAADEYELQQSRQQFADVYELNDVWQPFYYLASQVGSGVAEEVYKARKAKMQAGILEMGNEKGLDLILGTGQEIGNPARVLSEDEWYVNINGSIYEANPGFLAGIAREEGEIMGGAVGGILASQYVQSLNAMPGGRGVTNALRFGLVTAGITAGMVIGDQMDYTAAAIRQHEEYNWAIARDKALGSAQLGVVGEVIGAGVLKVGAASWRAIMHAYRLAADGNTNGAFDILIRSLDITEDQAHELVKRWEDVNQKQAPTMANRRRWYNPRKYLSNKEKEKAIAVLPTSKAGGEHIAPAIAEKNPRASAAIISEINQRAKSLVRAASGDISEGGRRVVAKELIDSIDTYRNDVGDYYKIVKQQGGELAPTGYNWNLDTMAIKPLAEDLISKIYPDTQRKTARNMLKRIDDLTETRTFEDLIELRQVINELRSKRSVKSGSYEGFQTVIDNIDNEIYNVSRRMGPDGNQWYKDWMTAKLDYSEMKKLTSNALSKILLRPGIDDKVVARALVKYGTALDGTYDDLIKQLPLDVQPNVEALIIDSLVEKFTDGNVTQLQATNFPLLRDALADYDFIWPRSKALREVVDTFAEIYQNDNALSYASGGIATTKFQSYLTTNPVVRAQFEIASGVFNQVKILLGGPKGDAAALIKLSAKLLEDPLNPHNVERALAAIGDNVELKDAVKRLSSETAAARHLGRSGSTTKIKIYKDGSGKLWTQPSEGREVIDGIPMHRMTNEEVAKKVSRATNLEDLSDTEKARLLNAGFTSIGLDDGTVLILN